VISCRERRFQCYCLLYTGSTDYHCYCYDGFYGRNCTLYDPCFSAPCQNNGHCRNLSDTDYVCRCRPGFHGVNCELYNPCADSPCLHGGMCNSIDGQFVCDCEPGYYGSVALSLNSCMYRIQKNCINIYGILRSRRCENTAKQQHIDWQIFTARCYAERATAMARRLSIRLSFSTLRYCGHIVQVTSKISHILTRVRLRFSLSASLTKFWVCFPQNRLIGLVLA